MDTENVTIKNLTKLISDKDFISLQKELSKFTPFDVLKLKSHEIRHSNVLAWLFNPYESHKLDNEFLKFFLYALSQNEVNEKLDEKLDEKSIEKLNEKKEKNINNALLRFLQNNYQISVKRESESKDNRRLDLKIKCSINGNVDLIILIENKIYAKQRDNQLKDYLDDELKRSPKALILPVFLTLYEDDSPDDERYYHITYFSIVDILEKVILVAEKNNAEVDAITFIKYYKKSLEELLGMNYETQNLAKELYKKYKTVIDYISANGESSITIAGNDFLKQMNDEGLLPIENKGNATFFPFTDNYLKSTDGGVKNDWRNGAVCGYFFQLLKNENTDDFSGKLYLKIEVGPFDSSQKREELLEILKKNNIYYKPGTNGNSKYTRLSYKNNKNKYDKKISDITDPGEVTKEMVDLFKSSEELREVLHKCIEKYNNSQKSLINITK